MESGGAGASWVGADLGSWVSGPMTGSVKRIRIPIVVRSVGAVGALVALTGAGLVGLSLLDAREMLLEAQAFARLEERVEAVHGRVLAYVGRQEERVALIAGRASLGVLLDEWALGKRAGPAVDGVGRAQADEGDAHSARGAGGGGGGERGVVHRMQALLRRAQAQGQAQVRGSGDVLGLTIVDGMGWVVASTDTMLEGSDVSGWPEFVQGTAAPHLGDPSRRSGGGWSAVAGAPGRTPSGRPFVLLMEADAAPVVAALHGGARAQRGRERREQRETHLVGPDSLRPGRVRLLIPPQRDRKLASLPQQEFFALDRALAGHAGADRGIDHHGRRVFAAYRQVGHRGWGVAVVRPEAAVHAPLEILGMRMAGLGVVAFLLSLFLGLRLAGTLASPLRVMTLGLQRMAIGEVGGTVAIIRNDEIGDLAKAFNVMSNSVQGNVSGIARELADRTAQLERAKGKLRLAKLKAERLSRQDPLTGLANETVFAERLEILLAEAERGRASAIVSIHLDHFDKLRDKNDTAAMDAALLEVAAALHRSVRTADLAARVADDEFQLLLPGTSWREAKVVADRARAEIEGIEWAPGKLTGSLGVAAILAGATADVAAARSEAAVNKAKVNGGNRVELADGDGGGAYVSLH